MWNVVFELTPVGNVFLELTEITDIFICTFLDLRVEDCPVTAF